MDLISAAIMFAFGILAGIVGGLLGIGGCSIMLPALYFLFYYSLPCAIGTTITAVIVTAISGATAHFKMKNIDFLTAKIITVSGALGAVLGSILFIYLAGNTALLSAIVGFAFIYTAIRMIVEGARRKGGAPSGKGDKVPGSSSGKGLLGFIIGVLTGIIGLGGGYALVPSFIYIFKSPVKIAVGTSLASFISMALISGLFKLMTGNVDLIAALMLGLGTALGAQLGAKLVPKTPAWMIKLLFGLLFLYVSLRFILAGFGVRI
ncbi:MAG: sulfite exporter TauE/SafE family protein [Thermoproteales archaeon]|nr:sulfite exporter TauE/SafE family protein [Thermoproteales archaeon]